MQKIPNQTKRLKSRQLPAELDKSAYPKGRYLVVLSLSHLSGLFVESWNDGLAISPSFWDVASDFDHRWGGHLQLQRGAGVGLLQPLSLLFILRRVGTHGFIKQAQACVAHHVVVCLLYALPSLQCLYVELIATHLWGLNKRHRISDGPYTLVFTHFHSQHFYYLVMQVLRSEAMVLQLPGFGLFALRRVLLMVRQIGLEGLHHSCVRLQLTLLHRDRETDVMQISCMQNLAEEQTERTDRKYQPSVIPPAADFSPLITFSSH